MTIFLDIDGVLNQLQRNHIDNACVARLSKIVKKLDGKVVLTSSWRIGYSNFGTCAPHIEKLKKMFRSFSIDIVGRTDKLGDRTVEIVKYIEKYGIDMYIVIDDDVDEFKTGLLKNTYIVNSKTGLTDKDVSKILKMKF